MYDISSMLEEIKRRDKLAALEREFPGRSCGNCECEKLCADALDIAKAMNLNPQPMVKGIVKEWIVPEMQCVPVHTQSGPASFFTVPCRFGFVRFKDSLALSDASDDLLYVFHAKNRNCEKCRSCDDTAVSAFEMKDESFMRKLGFWKQSDGVFRPHPNCSCGWERSSVDYSAFTWKKINKNKLATYEIKNFPVKLKHIPIVLQQKLASDVGLDVKEFSQWAQKIEVIGTQRPYTIHVDVPNVWICVDLLRGGSWAWDRSIVNWGGTIGQAVSAIGTWGKYEITCRTVTELKTVFEKNNKSVWGFVLYAHGNKLGDIANKSKDRTTQDELMSIVDRQGFKLGKLYLMQCESGADVKRQRVFVSCEIFKEKLKEKFEKGEISFDEYQKNISLPRMGFLKKNFAEMEKLSKEECEKEPTNIFVECKIEYPELVTTFLESWDRKWGKRVVGGKPNISYKGLDIMGFDI